MQALFTAASQPASLRCFHMPDPNPEQPGNANGRVKFAK